MLTIKKYIDPYSVKSYSQEGEDMILGRFFEKQKTGFYVDVGAHHPERFSNTYLFYKKGWQGINIDAMPNSMKLFNKKRARDINIETPISDKKETLTYYAFNEPALNTFSKELATKRDAVENYYIQWSKELETSTLKEILDTHLPKDQPIDFLSIDVEGLDLKVLQSNDFEKYRPKIIIIEIYGNTLSEIQESETTQYLRQINYEIYAKTVNSVLFISKKALNEGYNQTLH